MPCLSNSNINKFFPSLFFHGSSASSTPKPLSLSAPISSSFKPQNLKTKSYTPKEKKTEEIRDETVLSLTSLSETPPSCLSEVMEAPSFAQKTTRNNVNEEPNSNSNPRLENQKRKLKRLRLPYWSCSPNRPPGA